jgi:hypothetical protein
MVVNVEEVLTQEELAEFRKFIDKGVKLAKVLGQLERAERLRELYNLAKEQTCQVHPAK